MLLLSGPVALVAVWLLAAVLAVSVAADTRLGPADGAIMRKKRAASPLGSRQDPTLDRDAERGGVQKVD